MDLLQQAENGFQTVQVDDALRRQALAYLRQWLTGPEFAAYKPQLEWLIETKQWPGLLDRFYQILPFGTGGRRGPVGVGPNRMNVWTVAASVQGHCEYLKERFPGVAPLRVVVAYDVRRFLDQRKNYNPDLPNPVLGLSSKNLAHHAARVYAANGVHAHTLPADSPRYLATPELSFAIRQLQAHGGLNLSASHNPPDDNGGKFYDERGGQPVPPDDQIMADLVDQVTAIKSLPWTDAVRSGLVHFLDDGPHQAYLDLLRKQSLVPPPRFDEIKVVFTPLHGVGAMTALEVLEKQGFRVATVEEQMAPDGLFPNVTQSPNPEVPASMDKAAALAKRLHADLVLATDPDADRLGAMVPEGRRDLKSLLAGEEKWRFLNGNEIASLLTHFKLNKLAQRRELPRSPIVITTEVTTGQITRIARYFKAQIVNNLLVGFKYHADVLRHLEETGFYEDVRGTPDDFVIATEESHGILVTPQIRDKDAAGAALLMAELALDQKRRGRDEPDEMSLASVELTIYPEGPPTVLEYLDAMNRQFGYFRNLGVPVFMQGVLGKKNMAAMLDALRAAPPAELAGLSVTAFEDLRDENSRLGPLKGATDAASRNFLIFRFGERAKVVLRPSGTEPKAKAYVEVCTPPRPARMADEAWRQACQATDELADRLAKEFWQTALHLAGLDPASVGVR